MKCASGVPAAFEEPLKGFFSASAFTKDPAAGEVVPTELEPELDEELLKCQIDHFSTCQSSKPSSKVRLKLV